MPQRIIVGTLVTLSCVPHAEIPPSSRPGISMSSRAAVSPLPDRLFILPIDCRVTALGRLAIPVVIENNLAIARGIELPPVLSPDESPDPFGFDALAQEPEHGLVAIGESSCGPGPRTRVVMHPAERIVHEADVEYSATLAEGGTPLRVEVTFEWEEFPPEAPHDRRIERMVWVVCVAADDSRCIVVARDGTC